MFDHVIASLSPEFVAEVRDLILTPPAETPYDVLKAQLIKRTAASEQRRLQQLFSAEEFPLSYSAAYNSWQAILRAPMELSFENYFCNAYQTMLEWF